MYTVLVFGTYNQLLQSLGGVLALHIREVIAGKSLEHPARKNNALYINIL